MLIKNASWIRMKDAASSIVPVFSRAFSCSKPVESATLEITCAGVYEATLNGARVGRFILAPGWTQYDKRLQVQSYDITDMLKQENRIEVIVGPGWFRRTNARWTGTDNPDEHLPAMLIAMLHLRYTDGTEEMIPTDARWSAGTSNITLSGIFPGEDVDARLESKCVCQAQVCKWSKDILIPQEGPEVHEQEVLFPQASFRTPKGEWVIDFGQNLTGYMVFETDAHAGDKLSFSTAEVLDSEGNFYTDNYRFARSCMNYICKEGHQTYKPRLTFFGFRYLRINEAPKGFSADNLHAVVLHSEMNRTGWLECDRPDLNRLFQNILWGQKSNFLDIPTDCPQRDERYGWTGDAQVFTRAATYQYDVRQFFRKWLADMRAAQLENGYVPEVIPSLLNYKPGGAAWSDAVTIIPWQLYDTYGDSSFLVDMFDTMLAWVHYIPTVTTTPDLFTGCWTYGDWLALDTPDDYVPADIEASKRGYSNDDLISSAFYANSLRIVLDAAKVIGKSLPELEAQYRRTVGAFKACYEGKLHTQTEKVLALHFNLTDEPQKVSADLTNQIKACGNHLQTGFLGTPYLLHELSRYGYNTLAWDLLLRKEYPGWLYSVSKGATTVWEHWDGIKTDGTFWDMDMNSFNHYAYGAVADWVVNVASGIRPAEAGFAKALIAPVPDQRLNRLSTTIDTVHGRIRSAWEYTVNGIRYEIDTPVETEIRVNGVSRYVGPGHYIL